MSIITFFLLLNASTLTALAHGSRPLPVHADDADRFLANTAFRLRNRFATPAPLVVFCCVDHVDMRQLHSGCAEVEICAVGAGQVMRRLHGFATWVGTITTVDACRPYHLVTYLHQLT